MKKNKTNKLNKESNENSTKYGEFISSCFSWITLDKQKKRTKELENKTKE